jgi:hypothetical protein
MAPDNFKALATLSVKSCKPSRAERDSSRRFCHGVSLLDHSQAASDFALDPSSRAA